MHSNNCVFLFAEAETDGWREKKSASVALSQSFIFFSNNAKVYSMCTQRAIFEMKTQWLQNSNEIKRERSQIIIIVIIAA